ncbi:histone deacetylase family protein [Marixanthomonas spongiae]|uniref:Histone deacetylase n=1 Tax=Marixanthomonas spongiae TaxID=2174845 RepID=A0A2U0I2L9_9FLAO|nr:histone deacetylase [Marixanthomonas spongiae]PVW15314.1 histone deacetylase [Marixanthomonas spongiae]
MLKIAYHPIYKHPLPEGHRFPMEKYELLPQQLLYEGTCNEANFFEPNMPSEEHILAVHTEDYFKNLKNGTLDKRAARKIGFPLSETLVKRGQLIAQGTMQGCEYALEHGIAMNIAGGTHHAYTDHGEGFCIFNDQAIAARYLQNKGLAKKILIVDLDVHQGNGTAEIFHNDDSVFTFSMHGAGNYPFKKEVSDLDIPIPDGSGDAFYLSKLKETLPQLIEDVQPNFIFYLSGVDILETDKLGRLNCTVGGCKERDLFVFETIKRQEIPLQVSMGGGYSPDIKVIIDAHANTFRLAQDLFFV